MDETLKVLDKWEVTVVDLVGVIKDMAIAINSLNERFAEIERGQDAQDTYNMEQKERG